LKYASQHFTTKMLLYWVHVHSFGKNNCNT
jgi:hypothetical protein